MTSFNSNKLIYNLDSYIQQNTLFDINITNNKANENWICTTML